METISHSKKTLVVISESGNSIWVPSNEDIIHVCQQSLPEWPFHHKGWHETKAWITLLLSPFSCMICLFSLGLTQGDFSSRIPLHLRFHFNHHFFFNILSWRSYLLTPRIGKFQLDLIVNSMDSKKDREGTFDGHVCSYSMWMYSAKVIRFLCPLYKNYPPRIFST